MCCTSKFFMIMDGGQYQQYYQKDYFLTIIKQYENQNAQFRAKQCNLRHKLEAIECSMPALMCFNMIHGRSNKPQNTEYDCNPVKEPINITNQDDNQNFRNIRKDVNLRSCDCNRCPLNADFELDNKMPEIAKAPSMNIRNDINMRTCKCNPCPINEGIKTINPPVVQTAFTSTSSATSHQSNTFKLPSESIIIPNDVQFITTIKQLVQDEKILKQEIEELEHKEKVYNEILKQTHECPNNEIGYNGEGDFEIQALKRMNQELEANSKTLEEELDEVRKEIKCIQDAVEEPIRKELENEKCKCMELEEKLRKHSTDISSRETAHRKKVIFLEKQLQSANRTLNDLHVINKRLKEELCMLNCRYNELQTDLINQKLSEIHTISRITASQDRGNYQPPLPKPVLSLSGINSGDDLSNIARNLSKLLQEATACNSCKTTHPDLIDTVQYIKDLVEIVNKDKKRPSKYDENFDDMFCKCVDLKKIRAEMIAEETDEQPTHEILSPKKMLSGESVSSVTAKESKPETEVSTISELDDIYVKPSTTQKEPSVPSPVEIKIGSGVLVAETIQNILIDNVASNIRDTQKEPSITGSDKLKIKSSVLVAETIENILIDNVASDIRDTNQEHEYKEKESEIADSQEKDHEEIIETEIFTDTEDAGGVTDVTLSTSETEEVVTESGPLSETTELESEEPVTDTEERQDLRKEPMTEDEEKSEEMPLDVETIEVITPIVIADTTVDNQEKYDEDKLREDHREKQEMIQEMIHQEIEKIESGENIIEVEPIKEVTMVAESEDHDGKEEEIVSTEQARDNAEEEKTDILEEDVKIEKYVAGQGAEDITIIESTKDIIDTERIDQREILKSTDNISESSKLVDEVKKIVFELTDNIPKDKSDILLESRLFAEKSDDKEIGKGESVKSVKEVEAVTNNEIAANIVRTICKCIRREEPQLCDCPIEIKESTEQYITQLIEAITTGEVKEHIQSRESSKKSSTVSSKKSSTSFTEDKSGKLLSSSKENISISKKFTPQGSFEDRRSKTSNTSAEESSVKSVPNEVSSKASISSPKKTSEQYLPSGDIDASKKGLMPIQESGVTSPKEGLEKAYSDIPIKSLRSKSTSKEHSTKSLPLEGTRQMPSDSPDILAHRQEGLPITKSIPAEEAVVQSTKSLPLEATRTIPSDSPISVDQMSKKSSEKSLPRQEVSSQKSKPASKEPSTKSLPLEATQKVISDSPIVAEQTSKKLSEKSLLRQEVSPQKSKPSSKEPSTRSLPLEATQKITSDSPIIAEQTSKKLSHEIFTSKEKISKYSSEIATKLSSKEASLKSIPKDLITEPALTIRSKDNIDNIQIDGDKVFGSCGKISSKEQSTKVDEKMISEESRVSTQSSRASSGRIGSQPSSSKDEVKDRLLIAEVEAEGNVPTETDVELITKSSDGVYVTTTVTSSGHVEVTTEGPTGIVETTLKVTESGNLEVVTGLTEYDKSDEGSGKEIESAHSNDDGFAKGIKSDHSKDDDAPQLEVLHAPVCNIEESQDALDIQESTKFSDHACDAPLSTEEVDSRSKKSTEKIIEDGEKQISDTILDVIAEEEETAEIKVKEFAEVQCQCEDSIVVVPTVQQEPPPGKSYCECPPPAVICKCEEDEDQNQKPAEAKIQENIIEEPIDDNKFINVIESLDNVEQGPGTQSEDEMAAIYSDEDSPELKGVMSERVKSVEIIQEESSRERCFSKDSNEFEYEEVISGSTISEVSLFEDLKSDHSQSKKPPSESSHTRSLIIEEPRQYESIERTMHKPAEPQKSEKTSKSILKQSNWETGSNIAVSTNMSNNIKVVYSTATTSTTDLKFGMCTCDEKQLISKQNEEQKQVSVKSIDTEWFPKLEGMCTCEEKRRSSSQSEEHKQVPAKPIDTELLAKLKEGMCTCEEKRSSLKEREELANRKEQENQISQKQVETETPPKQEEKADNTEPFPRTTGDDRFGPTAVNNLKIIICNRESCKTYGTDKESFTDVPRCECGREKQRQLPKTCNKNTCGTSPSRQENKEDNWNEKGSNNKLLLENATCTTCDQTSFQVIKSRTQYASSESVVFENDNYICPETCPNVGLPQSSKKPGVCPKSCDNIRKPDKDNNDLNEKKTKSYSRGVCASTSSSSYNQKINSSVCEDKAVQGSFHLKRNLKSHYTNTPKSSKICKLDVCDSQASGQRTVSTYHSCAPLIQKEVCNPSECKKGFANVKSQTIVDAKIGSSTPILQTEKYICEPGACKKGVKPKSPSEPKMVRICKSKTCKKDAATDYKSQSMEATATREPIINKRQNLQECECSKLLNKSESIMETACTSLTCSVTRIGQSVTNQTQTKNLSDKALQRIEVTTTREPFINKMQNLPECECSKLFNKSESIMETACTSLTCSATRIGQSVTNQTQSKNLSDKAVQGIEETTTKDLTTNEAQSFHESNSSQLDIKSESLMETACTSLTCSALKVGQIDADETQSSEENVCDSATCSAKKLNLNVENETSASQQSSSLGSQESECTSATCLAMKTSTHTSTLTATPKAEKEIDEKRSSDSKSDQKNICGTCSGMRNVIDSSKSSSISSDIKVCGQCSGMKVITPDSSKRSFSEKRSSVSKSITSSSSKKYDIKSSSDQKRGSSASSKKSYISSPSIKKSDLSRSISSQGKSKSDLSTSSTKQADVSKPSERINKEIIMEGDEIKEKSTSKIITPTSRSPKFSQDRLPEKSSHLSRDNSAADRMDHGLLSEAIDSNQIDESLKSEKQSSFKFGPQIVNEPTIKPVTVEALEKEIRTWDGDDKYEISPKSEGEITETHETVLRSDDSQLKIEQEDTQITSKLEKKHSKLNDDEIISDDDPSISKRAIPETEENLPTSPKTPKSPKLSSGDISKSPKSASRYTLSEKLPQVSETKKAVTEKDVPPSKRSSEERKIVKEPSTHKKAVQDSTHSGGTSSHKSSESFQKYDKTLEKVPKKSSKESDKIVEKEGKMDRDSISKSSKASIKDSEHRSMEKLTSPKTISRGGSKSSEESICQPCGKIHGNESGDIISKQAKKPPDKDSKSSILSTESEKTSKSKIPVLIQKTSSQLKERHQGDCACMECLTQEKQKGHPPDCDCVDCLCQPSKFSKKLPEIAEIEQEGELPQHSLSCTCIDCLCQPKDSVEKIKTRDSVEQIKTKESVKKIKIDFVIEKRPQHSPSCDCIDCICAPSPEKEKLKAMKEIKKQTDEPVQRSPQLVYTCPSIAPTKRHHPDCKCLECVCDPCGHLPNCSCELCRCDPCKDEIVQFKKHPPDCTCPDCICAPCGDIKVKEIKGKAKHPPQCNCSDCICEPCDDKEVQERKEQLKHAPECKCPKCIDDSYSDEKIYLKIFTPELSEHVEDGDCTCSECLCDPCDDPKVMKARTVCEDCNCFTCICNPCDDPKVVARKKPHPPSCNCVECLCDPCNDPTKSRAHGPDCSCAKCVCQPCKTDGQHAPDCKCPSCLCESCPDPLKKKSMHGPDCKCKKCICKPCKSEVKKHGPDCNCSTCVCDPCSDPKKKKSLHGPDCRCLKCERDRYENISPPIEAHSPNCQCTVFKPQIFRNASRSEPVEPKKSLHGDDCICEKCNFERTLPTESHSPNCRCSICRHRMSEKGPKSESLQPKISTHGTNCVCEKCTCDPSKQMEQPTEKHSINCKCSVCKHRIPKETLKPKLVEPHEKHNPNCKCSECKYSQIIVKETTKAKPVRQIELPDIPEECPECDCSPICICDDCPAQRNKTAPIPEKMKDDVLKKSIKDIERENIRREKDIKEIEKLMKQIRCACLDAEKQATRTSPPEPIFIERTASFKNTLSGLQIAMNSLQDKCRTKDKMIEAMTQELKLRANSNIFKEMFRNMAGLPPVDVDFDMHEICDSLPRPINDPKYGTPSYRYAEEIVENSVCRCESGSLSIQITNVKQISPNSILVKWTQPASNQIIGYEVMVENVLKSRIHSAQRTSAIVFAVEMKNRLNVSVYALTQFGRCEPPATCIYGS